MKKQQMVGTRLTCGACGGVSPIARKASGTREAGHIKHMHCPKCQQVRPFIEHVACATERIWLLDEAVNAQALSRMSVLYNTLSGDIVELAEQRAILSQVGEELKGKWDAEEVIQLVESKGYKLHIMNTYL